jgi:hypothetical protein
LTYLKIGLFCFESRSIKAGLVIGTCLAFVTLIFSQSNLLRAQEQNDRSNILLILAVDIGASDIAMRLLSQLEMPPMLL